MNILHGRHATSEEELLSFSELRNYESSNSTRKTGFEFIDECVLPERCEAYLGCESPYLYKVPTTSQLSQ